MRSNVMSQPIKEHRPSFCGGALREQVLSLSMPVKEPAGQEGGEPAPAEEGKLPATPPSQECLLEVKEIQIGEEEKREVEAALPVCAKAHTLAVLSREEFFGTEEPRGCIFASLTSYLRAGETWVKGLCLVIFRRASHGAIEIYRYPESVRDLLSVGECAGKIEKVLLAENQKAGRTAKTGAGATSEKEPERKPAHPVPRQQERGTEPKTHTQLGTKFVWFQK